MYVNVTVSQNNDLLWNICVTYSNMILVKGSMIKKTIIEQENLGVVSLISQLEISKNNNRQQHDPVYDIRTIELPCFTRFMCSLTCQGRLQVLSHYLSNITRNLSMSRILSSPHIMKFMKFQKNMSLLCDMKCILSLAIHNFFTQM